MIGRRYFVVFMVFLGFLISIGSREVFTMVAQGVIDSREAEETNIFKLKCLNRTGNASIQRNWPHNDILLFQLTYFVGIFLTNIPGGMLAMRFPPRRIAGLSILGSSALFIVLRFDIRYYSSDWTVFLIRFIQGLLEGPIVPALNGVIAAWAPKSEKAKLLSFAYAGAYLSTAVSSTSTGLLICRISWGSPLLVYGGAGILWSLLWLLFVYDTPASCPSLSEAERDLFHVHGNNVQVGSPGVFRNVPWRKIARSVPLSAIVVAAFCRNWIFALLITQIPLYFKDVFAMDPANIGFWAALPHVAMAITVVYSGTLVDFLLKKHFITITIARKSAETLGFGIEGACLLALAFVKDRHVAVVLLMVGVGFSGFAISGYQVNPLDLAPQYSSVLTAIARTGSIGSVISILIPTTINNAHKWRTIFIIAGAIHLGGVLYYLLFASGELQPWAVAPTITTVNRDPDLVATESTESDRLLPNGLAHGDSNVHEESAIEKWLSSSVYINKMVSIDREEYEEDEEDYHSWYQNTI